jgi:UDP-N-acetylglucosamine--N-acetylmuramyl-(pentapeptide) pyrophosphoryl-undecaprenol N-acetylglucosamine transferase
MMRPPRILLAAGGTAGHIYPALAVGEEMRKRGWEVLFAGTARGREAELLRRAGIEPFLLYGAPYHRTTAAGRILATALIPLAAVEAMVLMGRKRVDAVIGFGGYASVGPVLAAGLLRRFSAIVEPNADLGKANRLLVRSVARVYAGAHTDTGHLAPPVVVRTGLPIRSEFNRRHEKRPAKRRKRIFVLGDEFLDARIPPVVASIAAGGSELDVVHQGTAGQRYPPSVPVRYAAHIDEVWDEYAAADVVISRAGAGTLAELAATGRAAILVPLGAAAEDHQSRNASFWSERGAALVVAEGEWDDAGIAAILRQLLYDDAARAAMAARAHELAVPDAAERLVNDVAEMLGRR